MRSSGARDLPTVVPAGPPGGRSVRGAVPAFVPAGIALAWAALLLAQLVRAPMSHDELAGGSLPLAAAAGIFGVGWVLMVAAMMLPSSYPMVRAFTATTADRSGRRDRQDHPALPDRSGGGEVARFLGGRATRPDPRRAIAVARFLGGYVAVWTGFGLALFAGDLGLHALVDGAAQPFATHTTLLGNALLIAGAFQLTDRKRRCLDRCRHPAAALAAAPVGALRMGREYGVHCLGSCWALMLAVFALGKPEVLWMAVFGAVMLYEKVGRHGLVVARLAGAALLAGSLAATFS
jgi:predicted metal-binding membrane protein